MAAEVGDIEDYDLYHYDFTTASEWEMFIAHVEEIIHQWKLQHKRPFPPMKYHELLNADWDVKNEKLLFADVEFRMTRYQVKVPDETSETYDESNENGNIEALDDIMNMEHDFIPIVHIGEDSHPHVLARWYGLRDFVVISPARGSIVSESKLKILLSSLCIAINNTNCEVPMFVRAMELWQKFYLGICEGRGIRTEFEMIHLRRIPHQCKHLTGLLSVFKSKIGMSVVEPVLVSARFTFVLQDWTSDFAWSQEPPDLDVFHGEVGFEELGTLPFGAICEPISSMTLYTSWPEVLETVVVDSESYTDFEPTQAPKWSLSAKKADGLACLLSDYLSEFNSLCLTNKTSEDLLGDLGSKRDAAGDFGEPLSLLTDSRIPNLYDILNYTIPKRNSDGPVSYELLMQILYYLFPDVEKNSTQPPYPEDTEKEVGIKQRMKTCKEGSLVWRLALVMAHAMHMFGGPKAATHIWHEFTQVLRYHWNTSTLIPGVASGFPDPKTCLLHQKLQMINCCIQRKVKREEEEIARNTQDSEESEDEFYDCNSSSDGVGDGDEAKSRPKHSLWNAPTGRLMKHGTLKLIANGQPSYIPHTQGETPKTEDQLEEDAEVLLQLGSDAEGSQLRAMLMSASLLSDMESFKAANPGAIIEDFIQWYSPRDWIKEDELDEFGQKKGHLSPRMLLPGNTWLEVWTAAKPVPARRQKRLFDDTREAEKALHFIESRMPSAAGQLLLPVLCHAALSRLSQEIQVLDIPSLHNAMDHMLRKAETLTRQTVDLRRYQDLWIEVNCAEAVIAQVKSLEHKLCPEADESMRQFIADLVTKPEVEVPGGPMGPIAMRIKAMFTEAYKASQMLYNTEPPSSGPNKDPWSPGFNSVLAQNAQEKEFILRCKAPRPSLHSKVVPHRLSARISKGEVFMAGAFSQDTVFM